MPQTLILDIMSSFFIIETDIITEYCCQHTWIFAAISEAKSSGWAWHITQEQTSQLILLDVG